jgi:hypothetical protein
MDTINSIKFESIVTYEVQIYDPAGGIAQCRIKAAKVTNFNPESKNWE